jgi:precorrin-3B methylase
MDDMITKAAQQFCMAKTVETNIEFMLKQDKNLTNFSRANSNLRQKLARAKEIIAQFKDDEEVMAVVKKIMKRY